MPSPTHTYYLLLLGLQQILLDAVAFHHFLLPGAFATATAFAATALATLAALAALEVASALARLAGLAGLAGLASLQEAGTALGGFSSLAPL